MHTSDDKPLYVTPIDTSLPGTVSLTMAPGKQGYGAYARAHWKRDLGKDLDRLVDTYGAGLLVCLLEDHELAGLGIPNLIEEASRRMKVLRLPIPDGGVLPDPAPVRDVVLKIEDAARAGINVVIHCRGGLGRAGTIGGCYLKHRGLGDEDVFAALRRRHKTKCPEREVQRRFIRAFTPVVRDEPRTSGPKSAIDRIAGSILGAAIGDAMGHPVEFMSLDAIRGQYGASGVTGFVKWWTDNGKRFAPYTDDTQMSEAVIRALLDARKEGFELDATMRRIADRFVSWAEHPQGGHRAPGNACLAGCRALARGVPWQEAGGATAGGCGSVMRAWPFGLFFRNDVDRAEAWAAEHSKLTHRDPIALAACAALARGVVGAVRGDAPRAVVDEMAEAAARYSPRTATMIRAAADEALQGVSPDVTLDRLRGWAAHEAVAAAVFVFLRHADDPRAAILEGANTPGDSDSIASITGALVGARCGVDALPADWVCDVERSEVLLGLAAAIEGVG